MKAAAKKHVGPKMSGLDQKIRRLPREQKKEIEGLVDGLLKSRKKKAKGKPAFKWAGIAQDLRDQYTSVELQHQISRWRAGQK